jgi:hypothetical protein
MERWQRSRCSRMFAGLEAACESAEGAVLQMPESLA